MAHSTQQACCSRASACRAYRRVAQMQASAVRQQQHACTSTAGVVAHCAAVPHRCPSAGNGVRPALPEHIGSDCSATRGPFSTGVETQHARKRGLDGQRGQRERREHARRASVPSFYKLYVLPQPCTGYSCQVPADSQITPLWMCNYGSTFCILRALSTDHCDAREGGRGSVVDNILLSERLSKHWRNMPS